MTKFPILITGANRGLGLEMVKSYLNDNHQVIAACREPENATELSDLQSDHKQQLDIIALDVGSARQRQALSEKLAETPLDMLISNAGVYGSRNQIFGKIDEDAWLETFKINTVAPLILSQLLLPNLLKGNHKTIAMLSSKMGSIDDNTYGRAYIYRSSKSALNSVVKSMSIDLKDDGVRVLALHPGWVRTDMGGADALIDAEESIAGLRQTMDRKDLSDSGRFFAYDGVELPW
ncbi:MAG: NAD(P)-dependent dehydrogenase (short-subunit alcohol dehydrogenase family) [Enterobacterales bacterium]|jgi:NAD(P)-dependent dehydrogenase (short-subunit alcohol dehydrogenase family)